MIKLCKDCKHHMPDTDVGGIKTSACALTAQCPVSGSSRTPDSCWPMRHGGPCGMSGVFFEEIPKVTKKAPKGKAQVTPEAAPQEVPDVEAE